MKKVVSIITVTLITIMVLGGLARPVNAQEGEEVPVSGPGWELETAFSQGGEAFVKTLQSEGLQPVREGEQLKVSGAGGLEEVRQVLYGSMGSDFSLIGSRTDMDLSLPLVKDQVLTLKLETNLTTGYNWVFNGIEGGAVTQVGEGNYQTRSKALIGAPQVLTLTFKSSVTGDGKINLSYKRLFGPQEAAVTRLAIRLAETPGEVDLSDPNPKVTVDLAAEGPEAINEYAISDIPEKALPASYDLRAKGYITPIRDQKSCGSCWAFAAVGAMEAGIKKYNSTSTNLSEQYMVSCNPDGWSCKGGWESHGLHVDILGKNQTQAGAVTESAKPYTATNGTCTVAYSHPYKAYDWHYVTATRYETATVTQIKNTIYNYGPVWTTLCAGSNFQAYRGGVFSTDETNYCSGWINHAVLLVGWNDSTESWIMRNSWNTGWGESGYMRIKWGTSRIGFTPSYIRYRTTQAPTVPTTVSPSGTITDKTPAYKWTKITGATSYQVQVYRGTTKVLDKTYSSSICSGSYCQVTPTTTLSSTGYKWHVRAYKSGWYSFSSYKSFTVAPVPTTVSPSGTITDTTPTFRWTKVAGGTKYAIEVYRGSTKVYYKEYTSAYCSTTYCQGTPGTVLWHSAHKWRVRVYANGAWQPYGPTKSFTVGS